MQGKKINWYLQVLNKYMQFKGRACRSEYWYFFLFNLLIGAGINLFSGILGALSGHSSSLGGVVFNVYQLALFIPFLAVGVRRMHDTGHSGWWIILPIVNFIFLCLRGDKDANKYGPAENNLVQYF